MSIVDGLGTKDVTIGFLYVFVSVKTTARPFALNQHYEQIVLYHSPMTHASHKCSRTRHTPTLP